MIGTTIVDNGETKNVEKTLKNFSDYCRVNLYPLSEEDEQALV